jgi:hypothetical protein
VDIYGNKTQGGAATTTVIVEGGMISSKRPFDDRSKGLIGIISMFQSSNVNIVSDSQLRAIIQ